jgi:hypothetical protein
MGTANHIRAGCDRCLAYVNLLEKSTVLRVYNSTCWGVLWVMGGEAGEATFYVGYGGSSAVPSCLTSTLPILFTCRLVPFPLRHHTIQLITHVLPNWTHDPLGAQSIRSRHQATKANATTLPGFHRCVLYPCLTVFLSWTTHLS